jgi:hypothetical protein
MHDNQENISTVEEIPEDQIKSATDNGIADSVSVPVPDLISLCMDSSSTTKEGLVRFPNLFYCPLPRQKEEFSHF